MPNADIKAKQWMIYGASGYTGAVIAEHARENNASLSLPFLAGRDEEKIKPLAQRLGLQWRIFDLNNAEQLKAELHDIDLVLHCAGPFSATSAPMVDACIATHTHYLDITGEFKVLEAIKARSADAKAAGCSLIPAVGFDVVPTDCLANMLHKRLPDASHLEMAFCGKGGASPGTMKTMIEMLGEGGYIRRNGEITQVAAAFKQKIITFSHATHWCMTIPWGDISTAFTSTGIANIEIYTAVPKRAAKIVRWANPLLGIMRFKAIQHMLKAEVGKRVRGPDKQSRESGSMHLWAKVTNDKGEVREACLDVAEGYEFTVMSALAAVQRVLEGGIATGTLTPAQAFGEDYVLSFDKSCLSEKD